MAALYHHKAMKSASFPFRWDISGLVIIYKPFIISRKNHPFDIIPKDPYYDSAKERFNKRSRIRKFGCKYLPIIADLIEQNSNGEKMNIEEELLVLSTFHSGKLQFQQCCCHHCPSVTSFLTNKIVNI